MVKRKLNANKIRQKRGVKFKTLSEPIFGLRPIKVNIILPKVKATAIHNDLLLLPWTHYVL